MRSCKVRGTKCKTSFPFQVTSCVFRELNHVILQMFPSNKDLICQVTTNSSLGRQGEFDFYPLSKTTLLLVENRYFRSINDFVTCVT